MKISAFVYCILLFFVAVIARADSFNLNGIAGGGNFNISVTSFAERRFKTVYKQQFDFSCGSAALASLLTFHYNDKVDEQTVFVDMYENGDQKKIQKEGFSLLDMKMYLGRHGYIANGYKIDLNDLVKINAPAITIINNNGYLHFVIVKGISEHEVLVGDPAVGVKRMPRTDFELMRENRIFFLINDKQLVVDNHFQDPNEWALHPKAPLEDVVNRESLATFNLLQPGYWDF
ncbi:C39 family peptidase [Methylomonas sp. MgM2]